MSARMPFVPGGGQRPASRAQLKEQQPSFTPDPNSPLNAEKFAPKPTESDSLNSAVQKPTFRPLNTANLLKKNPTSAATSRGSRTSGLSRRPSGPDSSATRPFGDAQNSINRPRSTQNVYAPTPVVPSNPASPLFSSTTAAGIFAAPNNSISIKTPNFTLNSASRNSPNIHSPNAAHLLSPEPVPLTNPFKLPHPSQGGPGRVLIDSNNDNSVTSASRLKRALTEPEDDLSELSFDVNQQKRYKVDTDVKNSLGYSRPPAFSPQIISSSPAPAEFSVSPENHSFDIRHGQETQHPPEYQPGFNHSDNFGASNALNRLLGRDVDGYVESQADKYDQLAAKWRDCTMEEWIAGADEIAAKYAKILDFVKSHMTAKLKLFANFDSHVDDHNKVLTERQETLAAAKQRLLSEAGNLLIGNDKNF